MKSSADALALSTATGCGRKCALSASRMVSVSHSLARSTCATWPRACTPASVRPAPCTSVFSPDSASIAVRQHALHGELIGLDLPAAERRAVIFDDEFVAGHQATAVAGFDRRAAQEFVRRHRLLAGALHLHEPHRAVAAGDGELVVEHRARRRLSFGLGRAQRLDAHAIDLEPGAGKRRQAANVVVHLVRRLRPIDARFVLGDLRRVSDAGVWLRRQRQRAALGRGQARAASDRRRAAPTHRADRPRSCRRAIAHALDHRHRAGVEALVHLHDGDAALLVAGHDGAVDRRRAAPARQQRGVHVETAEPRRIEDRPSAGSGHRRRPPRRRRCARGTPRCASAILQRLRRQHRKPEPPRFALDRRRLQFHAARRRAWRRAYRPPRSRGRARRARAASAPRNRACP